LLGLAREGAPSDYEERLKQHIDAADKVWEQLPEVAAEERDSVIFFAKLPHFGKLVVTRYDQGYLVLRVINEDLLRLQQAAEELVRDTTSRSGHLDGLEVYCNEAEIYERGHTNVIMRGRVIDRALGEASRRHPEIIASLAVTLLATVVTLAWLAFAEPAKDILRGSLERFSTAMIAAFFISLVTLIQKWSQLKRKGGIDWQPVSSRD
ncbi:MAG TPA: hypothetical protein VLI04_01885, partial [Nocardioidaceae bacterium]|nr:hypothetical protein [Nocardioidaceae bacterium]